MTTSRLSYWTSRTLASKAIRPRTSLWGRNLRPAHLGRGRGTDGATVAPAPATAAQPPGPPPEAGPGRHLREMRRVRAALAANPQSPVNKHEAKLRTIVGDDAAAAELIIMGQDFVGDSKRHPCDRFNYRIGEKLAIARALQEAADYFRDEAEEEIRAADRAATRHGELTVHITPDLTRFQQSMDRVQMAMESRW